MLKYIFLLTTLILSGTYAELVNINPDPDGEPWWIGGISEPTPELMERINSLPVLTLPEKYKLRKDPLPSSADNSVLQYFRPVFNQSGGSCGQASGIGYNFTYEMNFMRNTSAADSSNQYPTHHTYNFLNDGNRDIGSWYFDGWEIIRSNGCPDLKTYGGLYADDVTYRHQLWTDGFEKYETGMNNRVTEQFTIPVGTPEGLETLKHYMIDHADGSAYGGVVNFAAGIGGTYQLGLIPAGKPHAGEYLIRKWHTEMNHAMTFAGYDDSVRWDCNNDGKFTNNLDINGDSIIDMKDWEIGALLMVNSYGTNWPNTGLGGKCWVLYRTLAMDISGGGIWGNSVHSIRTRTSFNTTLKAKAFVSHSNRSELKIFAGISADTSDTTPEYTLTFPLFLYQGGDYGMKGDGDSLELGLDISPLLSYVSSDQPARIFLCFDENDPDSNSSGQVISFSVIDADSTEIFSTQANKPIENNTISYISVIKSTAFNSPEITTISLPVAVKDEPYSFQLTGQNGTAPYSWAIKTDYSEIANSNIFPSEADSLVTTDSPDDGFAVVSLDFDFPFYGKKYDQITLSTDGSILFGGKFESVRSEGGIMMTRAITPYCGDLINYPEYGEGIFVSKNSNYIAVRWITSLYGQPQIDLDFAAKLYPDGKIEFFYNDSLSTGLNWASGISDGNSYSSLISSLSNINDPSSQKTSFTAPDFPYGMSLSSSGIFSGILTGDDNTWNIQFRVTDDRNISGVKTIPFSLISGLDVPLIISFSADSSSASITWGEVGGAETYGIYRSDQPYGSFIKIASSENLYYIDSSISGHEKMFYYVKAEKYKK